MKTISGIGKQELAVYQGEDQRQNCTEFRTKFLRQSYSRKISVFFSRGLDLTLPSPGVEPGL